MAGPSTFTLARFDRARVPALLAAVPFERMWLRRRPGLAWARHLGTASGGRTLGADPSRWAWFCAWDDAAAAGRFHDQIEARLHPREVATLSLRTSRARGRWGGHELEDPEPRPVGASPGVAVGRPDGPPAAPDPGPLVVLTRARVRAARWRPFTGAVPPIDADLAGAPGLLRSVGVGEWPVLVLGTLSIWEDARAMAAFARTEAHREAVRRTVDERWYAEELFARFSVDRVQGTWDGSPPLTARAPAPGR